MTDLPETIEGVPNICGREDLIDAAVARGRTQRISAGTVDLNRAKASFACALHMHQPLIPAGGGDLHTAEVISNLKDMWDHQDIGDNHNAPVFAWCYKRMGEFIPQLVGEGKQPRIMLEYSGTLLWGLAQMGQHDVLDALRTITMNPDYRGCVDWLGCPWGHAVAPSTPVQDFRLHVRAWQHHFAAMFGLEALERVRGFSPSEMALPNHPDVAYEFVKTLKECGYQWVLVQEHTVEQPEDGHHPHRPHLPHRLVCTNGAGETVSIIAIVKTQGSDTKLVAQMQPWYEAMSLDRLDLAGHSVPPLVTQIADGENGGVMMNEFPDKFFEGARGSSGSDTPMVNASEYLEWLFDQGITEDDLPAVQPLFHKRIWEAVDPGCGSEKLNATIEELKKADDRFHMDGGSWTNDISWVQGYDNVLGPMEQVSSQFQQTVLSPGLSFDEQRVRKALFYLLTCQTSCYRYWGQGRWTDYGRELCRRASEILKHDF